MSHRPQPTEYAPYYDNYIRLVPDAPIAATLVRQFGETESFYRRISERQAGERYAPGKWTIKQVIGHMMDTERVFAYRALAISRRHGDELPSFEQDDYVAAANFDQRSWRDLVDEFASVRAASVGLFERLPDDALDRRGIAAGNEITVRACGFICAGHELYHVVSLKDRYRLD